MSAEPWLNKTCLPPSAASALPQFQGPAAELPVEAEGRLRSQSDFENLILRRLDNGGLLRLKDVGRVALGQRNYGREAMNLNGERSVAVGIYQRDGANALEVSGCDQAEAEAVGSELSPGHEMQ